MLHKFVVKRIEDKGELQIKEYANLEREPKHEWQQPDIASFALVGQETYGKTDVTRAIKKGRRHLVSVLRTRNMYPIGIYADEIASSVIQLYASKTERTAELSFDDKSNFDNDANG